MNVEHVKEFVRCKKDPVHFIQSYCYIEHPTEGKIPFNLYDFQEDVVRRFRKNNFVISNKSRQIGMSTLTANYALWLALFHKNKNIVILSIKDQDAQAFLKKIKLSFESLPGWMKDTPLINNAHELSLSSGSTIRSVASGKQAARGQALSLLIVDEAAFISEIDDIWKAAYPTLCLHPDTMVLSDKGIQKISDIINTEKIGEFVAPDENQFVFGDDFELVSKHYISKPSKTLTITTKLGTQITVTPDHKLMTEEGMVAAKDLKKGNFLQKHIGMDVYGSEWLEPDEAYRLGGWVAEGWITQGQRGYTIWVSNTNDEFRNEYLKEGFVVDKSANHKLRLCSKKKVEEYIKYGVDPNWKCDTKEVPKVILESDFQTQRHFFAGLFDGDGCIISERGIVLSSRSNMLLQQVQLMLSNMGIVSNITESGRLLPQGKVAQSYKGSWVLTISKSQFEDFRNKIHLTISKKRKKLYSTPRRNDFHKQLTVPITAELEQKFSQKSITWWRKNGVRVEKQRKTSLTNYQVASKMLSLLGETSDLVSPNYFWDEIVSIENNETEITTYDFTVENSHKFLQNGLMGSNSRGGSAILISCVTGDTLVYTDNGIKRVDSFSSSGEPGTYDECEYSVLGKDKLRSGNIFYNNGISDIHEIETQHSIVKCSPEHKFWVYDGEYYWEKAKNITDKHWLSIQYGMEVWGDNDDVSDFIPEENPRIENKFHPSRITKDIAYFLGMFIAEGSTYIKEKNGKRVGGSVTLTCGDDISHVFESLGLPFSSHNGLHYTVSSKHLVEFLEYLGFDLTKRAPNRVIPERLLEMSRDNIIALLQGIFDGGGWSRKDKGTVGIGLPSYELVNQIRTILHNLGILTNYKEYVTPQTKKINVESVQHRLLINRHYSKMFFDIVGFRFARKRILNDVGGIHGIAEPNLKWVKVKSNRVVGRDYVYDFSLPHNTEDEFCHSVVYNSVLGHQTPNGLGNLFYKLWTKCQPETPKSEKNQFHPIFVHWTQIPEYRGFDDVDNLTFQEIYRKATECEWYQKMRPQFTDREWAQEFEGDFLGSGLTLVKPEILKEAKENLVKEPISKEGPEEGLWIWENPKMDSMYVIGADPASGEGDDFSTAQVLDWATGEQVAEYQGKITILDFADFLVELAVRYNGAFLVPEYTGLGKGTVQKIVYEIGYSNIYHTMNETTRQTKKNTYGWNTTEKTKPLLIAQLQKHFNSGEFNWYSKRLWNELTTFVWKNNHKVEADGDNNDDLVLAFALASYGRHQMSLLQPVEMQREVYNTEPDNTRLDGYLGEDKMIDPYSFEVVDIEREPKFDPDSEEDVTNWLLR